MSWAASSRRPLWRPLRRMVAKVGLGAVIGVCAAAAGVSEAAAGDDIGIIVTNAHYARGSGIADVKYAENDGEAMKAAMRQLFKIENIKTYQDRTKNQLNLLFGEEHAPDRGQIWKLVQTVNNPKARLFVYYSGHGVPYQTRDRRIEAGLLSADADFDNLEGSAYPLQTLRDNLKAIKQRLLPQGEVILILEACFSGQTGENKPLLPGTSGGTVIPITYTAPPAEIIEIDAAEPNQVAFWDDASQRGLFTNQFLWGLYGRADSNGDNKVTFEELKAYLTKHLPERLEGKGAQQTASFSRSDNTPLAVGPWPRREDMIEAEARESPMCNAMLQHKENYPTLQQHVEALNRYDKTCAWCGCQADVRTRLNELGENLRTCQAVKQASDASADPGYLLASAEENRCPELHDGLLSKAWSILKDTRNAGQIQRLIALLPPASPLRQEAEGQLRPPEKPKVADTRPGGGAPPNGGASAPVKTPEKPNIADTRPGGGVRPNGGASAPNASTGGQQVAVVGRHDAPAVPAADLCSGPVTVSFASRCAAPLTTAQERGLKPKDTFRECEKCPEMVVLPTGSFTMGSPKDEKDRDNDEGPQHIVTIAKPFAVGKLHVMVDQFATFIAETRYEARSKCNIYEGGKWDLKGSWRNPGFAQEGSHPAVCVSWSDAKAYVDWLAKKTGKPYRLLSEGEFEYAARGQTSPGAYPRFWFGNDEKDLCRYGNGTDQKAQNSIEWMKETKGWTFAPCNDRYAYTSPAGHYEPNAFGLYDMAGNASQWTEDCYHATYNGAPANGSAWTAATCTSVNSVLGPLDLGRVVRGGSWEGTPTSLRAARRVGFITDQHVDIGFRLARTLTP